MDSRFTMRDSRRFMVRPATEAGYWAVGLAVASVVLVMAWAVIPAGALFGFAAGLIGGVFALFAILRRGERAVTVYLALVPFALVVAFVLAELLIGHD